MNILVLGGTRFFGKHLVRYLLLEGHEVTIATRGRSKDDFKDYVKRMIVERTDSQAMKRIFSYKYYDVVYDDLAYCAGDVKTAMEAIRCRRYIMVSSASVYRLHFQTTETDFKPEKETLVWYEHRKEAPYDVLKKSAESALVQVYQEQNAVFVRFPFVIGEDDYTKRLYWYVQHIIEGRPVYIDNQDSQMSFVSASDAGRLLAFLGQDDVTGAVNGASRGTISVREIILYVEKKTGRQAKLTKTGDPAPYNGAPQYSINTEKAERAGFCFSNLKDWIYELLDFYIETAQKDCKTISPG